MIRIVVDAMGGDNAPVDIVEGTLAAIDDFTDVYVTLVGKTNEIKKVLDGLIYDPGKVTILEAPDVISNDEAPVMAVRRKKESSIVKGMRVLADMEADGFVSAGSTGAVLAASTLILKRADGIYRPALAPVLPTATGNGVLLVDAGANVDCKPEFLAQFAVMGSAYMEKVQYIQKPRVGLVNNGAEAKKGNELVKAVYPLLEQAPINFVGNVEARDITSGDVDVIVCDGFVGNVILKFMEGMAGTIFGMLKDEFLSSTRSKMGAAMLKPALANFKKKTDYTEYGGAPLLGVTLPVVKAHGSSNAKAFRNAIRQCRDMIKNNVVGTIAQEMKKVDFEAIENEE